MNYNMSWFDKIRQIFSAGDAKDKSQDTAILSTSSKVDPKNRVKPKQEVIPIETKIQPGMIATTSKTDKTPTALARPNNPEMQARVDKRTRVIEQ